MIRDHWDQILWWTGIPGVSTPELSHDLADAAEHNPTLLPLGQVEKMMFSCHPQQSLALQNSYPESFLCFSSGDETRSPLLPPALLCPGSAEGVSGTRVSQRAVQRRDVSGSGVAHQISSPWPGSLLALFTVQMPLLAPVLHPWLHPWQHQRNIKLGRGEKGHPEYRAF